jgi:hypothetical protein
MESITVLTGLISVLEIVIPKIAELVKSGEITPEQQQTLLDRKDALLEKLDEAFSGPEWEVTSVSTSPSVAVPPPVA